MLVQHGSISHETLQAALHQQKASGSRLGDTLLGEGAVGPLPLSRAIATHRGLPHVNLRDMPPDESLLESAHVHEYIARRALPWRREGEALVVATSEPGTALSSWAETRFGMPCRFVIASDYDIRMAIEERFSSALDEESRLHLHRIRPQHSARRTFTLEQRTVFSGLTLGTLFAVVYAPWTSAAWAAIFLHALYATTMIFKLLVFGEGLRCPPLQAGAEADGAPLPLYTILVPLYDEAVSLPHLMAALKRLDYPASKLDIKLLLEQEDAATHEAAQALKLPWNVEIIRLPPSFPRTKPKALNYGLRFARGEFLTVYDAEDAPDPAQLKRAVAAFRALPEKVVCLQARLSYYNAADNLLTAWFALEYGALFGAMLPGLQSLGIPLPLGGTSNHTAVRRLRKLGAWDPFNVTEDADLGVRLSLFGLKTAMLDSVTLEEAPLCAHAWFRQRSRWVKGYMQTWLVHMRDPFAAWRRMGTVGFFGLHYFVGMAPVTFLTAPLVWGVTLMTWLKLPLAMPPWFIALANANLLLHFGVHWVQAFYAMPRLPEYQRHRWRFRLAALTYPFYWALHSLAAYKALWQLLFRPHFWEKTAHGLAKRTHCDGIRN